MTGVFGIGTLTLAACWLLACGSSRAATYTVNSIEDQPDANVADGVCSAASSGACTLRAAIMQANAVTGLDTITVPAGVYQITRVGADDTGLNGDLDISDSVTIQGAGAAATIIDGNGPVTDDRVFHIRNTTAHTVTLNGMTIRNGRPRVNGTADNGGGIFAKVFRLYLNDVVLASNTAARGGGLYAENVEVFMNTVGIRDNSATVGEGGGFGAKSTIAFLDKLSLHANTAATRGGGLWADDVQVEIRDSVFDHNTAHTGGGIALTNAYFTKIDRTDFFSNTAATGGAVENGTVNRTTLTDCRLFDNHASTSGGAINNIGALALMRTTVDRNSAALNGGGIMIPGLSFPQSIMEVRIENSTLSRNTAQHGGAIYYNETDDPQARHSLVLRNSTVAANRASRDGGGIYTKGIARVFSSSATIAGNALNPAAASDPARGGGLFSADTSYVSAENTLIGDNFFSDGVNAALADDVYTATTTSFRSSGYNLIEATANHTVTGTTTGCIFGQDPKLHPAGLANYGGTTETIALSPESAAANAGNHGVAPATDQRGIARNGTSDIGAFEFVAVNARITNIARAGSAIVIDFAGAEAGRSYSLQRTLQLSPANWQPVAAGKVTPSGSGSGQFVHQDGATEPRAFYRIVLAP